MLDTCPFCRIAAGTAPAHEIFRTEKLVAFLDRGPIRPGHVQIIPVAHIETFELLPPDIAAGIMTLGQRIAQAQKALYGVERVAFLFTGGDIPHAHAHLVPILDPVDITSRRYIQEEKLTFAPLPTPGDTALRQTAANLAARLGP